jgi:hypothetical protein
MAEPEDFESRLKIFFQNGCRIGGARYSLSLGVKEADTSLRQTSMRPGDLDFGSVMPRTSINVCY